MGSSSPNEELCLKWNDFESILSRSFCEMRDERDFFDVRIACFDDKSVMKTLPAHRVVLSACSPVFKELLRAIGANGDSKGPLIFLRGISYHDMEAVLDFMYNGQTKVSHTELDAFLAAAEELKIKGLTSSGNESSSSSSSRKRPNLDHDQKPAKNSSLSSKKPRPASAASSPMPGPSSSSDVVVKAEHVNVDALEEDSFAEYTDADLEEGYTDDYSNLEGDPDDGGHHGADAFPAESKGNPFFFQ